MTTKSKTNKSQVLGEFGRFGGSDVVTITAAGKDAALIRRLWKQLDDADAIEQDDIIQDLDELGAVSRDE